MRKKVMVKSVPIGGLFYADSTFYKRKVVLHNNCYDRISKGCFAIGFSGTNEDVIVAFNEETLVEIDVPVPKYRDIKHNQQFKVGCNKYLKLDTIHEYKPLNFAIDLSNGCISDFSPDDEVEKV